MLEQFMPIYRFRNCLVNTVERSVIQEKHILDLTPRTFDVLLFLIENVGKIVTKDEILGYVWSGCFIEESNLPVHISKLRRSLGESSGQRFIETVQGVGYRFVAPVQLVDSGVWEHTLRQVGVAGNKSPSSDAFDSIVVFPLENDSSEDSLDYIADGITESITNSLSRVPRLQVIARNTAFRYKNKPFDLREVGETLGVSSVLTGRIRIVGNDFNLSAELVDVSSGAQIWGKQFYKQFSDIISVQEEVSNAVVQELRSRERRVTERHQNYGTANAESYKLYLKGKYFLNKKTVREIEKAIDCFQNSMSSDNANLYACAELIECYRLLYILEALSYEETVLAVRPLISKLDTMESDVDVVELARARRKFCLDWDFVGAQNHCKTALLLNPNNIDVHFHSAEILAAVNRPAESVWHLERILTLDPLSVITYKRIGRGFYRVGNFESALNYLNVAIEMEPEDFEAQALIGAVFVELGDYDKALAAFHTSRSSERSAEVLAMIGYTHALNGNRRHAIRIARELETDIGRHSTDLARIYLGVGDKNRAYELLGIALETHKLDLTSLHYDPRLKSIRDDSQFRALMVKTGLPLT